MISFQDVADSSGLAWTNQTAAFSAAWTDFNDDGLPDLLVSRHIYTFPDYLPQLYLNQGDGSFIDIAPSAFEYSTENADTHGIQTVDFDNDGDQDWFAITGAQGGLGADASLLFINDQGLFRERASQYGVNFPLGRGRSPLWFDWNNDGLLDLLQLNEERADDQAAPTTLFQQTENGFVSANELMGLNLKYANTGQITDLFGNGTLDLVTVGWSIYERQNDTFEFKDITSAIRSPYLIQDLAIADFNGDLVPDIFALRSNLSYVDKSHVLHSLPNRVFAQLMSNSGEKGVSFQTVGSVTFDFLREGKTYLFDPSQIFIGAGGYHPDGYRFSLDPNDPNSAGILPRGAGTPGGLYIGYDPASQTWQAINFTPAGKQKKAILVFESSAVLENVNPIGFNNLDLSSESAQPPALILYDPNLNKYVVKTQGSGLEAPMAGRGVASGDFDNDGDLDLFIVRSNATSLPNILYENQGNGVFTAVPLAGGAQKETALGLNFFFDANLPPLVADYDRDGFLDIYVPHAAFKGSADVNYLTSPHQLYHNQGNGNAWVEIDLEGTLSNRDGIGAKVYVTAGGKTQLREQNGGRHQFGQNSQILHFGLGANAVIETIEVRWPSGVIETWTNIAPNQVLALVENSTLAKNEILGAAGNDRLKGTAGADRIKGLAGNDTLLGLEGNDSLVGGAGVNTADYLSAKTAISVNLTAGVAEDGLGGLDDLVQIQNVAASNYADILRGDAQKNVLNGRQGADQFWGGAGDDTLKLGNQDGAKDIVFYRVGDGKDSIAQFEKGLDQLAVTGIAALDVKVVNNNTQLRVGNGVAGDSGFGSGAIVMTLQGVAGLTPAELGPSGSSLAPGNEAVFFFS
ncbi:MAG: hypothetical protein GC158_12790 [Cyanobacteria bacterium RI_101]|nr:hypothetical protein [Cyanobacteria bacterium RI_101]